MKQEQCFFQNATFQMVENADEEQCIDLNGTKKWKMHQKKKKEVILSIVTEINRARESLPHKCTEINLWLLVAFLLVKKWKRKHEKTRRFLQYDVVTSRVVHLFKREEVNSGMNVKLCFFV